MAGQACPVEPDRSSPVAPYVQVAAWLAARIRSGELSGRVPSADDISYEAGIAKYTARKVLRLLQDQGYVTIAVGLGTFTTSPENWPGDH
jgi:DNA-binding GntR family transcriptional regulator